MSRATRFFPGWWPTARQDAARSVSPLPNPQEVLPLVPRSPTPSRRASRFRPLAPVLLGLGLLAAGCAPGRDLQPLPEVTVSAYRFGPGDQIRVTTFDEQGLTGEFRVSDNGNIAFPLIGNVRAGGRTADQLGSSIGEELKRRRLIRDPSVVVEVVNYRPIFVLGEVAKPGEYPYRPGMTLLTAVAVAGGYTYRAVTDYASVVRVVENQPTATEGKVMRQSLLEPGDTVTVFERRF